MSKVLKKFTAVFLIAIFVLILPIFYAGCESRNDETDNETGIETDNKNENKTDTGENIMKNPIITIEMSDGQIIQAELYPDKAHNTVNNFISLASSGFYDGIIFHRVIYGFMIQGGDPAGVGTGGPGYKIKGEFALNGFMQNDIKHERGVLSMARAQHPDSAGSQFFIMHKNASHLDGQYAAFGRVIKGIEVVDEIASVETDIYDKPLVAQVMKKVTVETFGVQYAQPEKC